MALVDRWWLGVEWWYNGAYTKAASLWFQAVDDYDWDRFFETSHEEVNNNDKQEELEARLGKLRETILSMDKQEEEKGKDTARNSDKHLALLLLFLSGCALDASDISLARTYLFRCLTLCVANRDANVGRAAVEELMASYREDTDCPQPWRMERRLVEFAIQNASHGLVFTKWNDPFQRPAFLCDLEGPNQSVYQRNQQPRWCHELEKQSGIIVGEFQDLLGQQWETVGAGVHRGGAGEHDGSVVEGTWQELVLFGSGAQPHVAPKTCQLVQTHCRDAVQLAQEGAGEIIFSLLKPHTRIKPHTAAHNLRLTAHLGLRVPQGNCFLRVADHKLEWKVGKILVFDDSYEHEVVNETDDIRAVLLLRFWHPSLRGDDTRREALQDVLNAKHSDRMCRLNPPLPYPFERNKQGMELSQCPNCFATGFESVRYSSRDRSFYCICGMAISTDDD